MSNPSQADACTEARRLVAEGRILDAIPLLSAAIAAGATGTPEILLAELRNRAYTELEPRSDFPSWPAPVSDLDLSAPPLVPRIAPADLRADDVRREMLAHGSVHVPDLFGPSQIERFVQGIQQALATREAMAESPYKKGSPWFSGLPLPREQAQSLGRPWIAGAGGMLACDSPRMLELIFTTYEEVGLRRLLTDYLGERPILSANKCTLREVPTSANTDWHQDGAFIGTGVRALNVWIALTDCGVDAPGMDLVPRRFEDIQETGTGGAIFDWAVGPDTVTALSANHPVVRPTFREGDALLFDDLFLHRTGLSPEMRRTRFAIESWFFAATGYPEGQVPLVW